ncbi:HTH-type transcriptional regulator [Pleomorphomonas sp. T1.2MG-36]|uniref:ArsR/SmtB family transcription factor n=1 Tax=Pleomorphomonas sp. T1.2MG-36 TaxID=3041167 RepID=UPI0024779B70|nr:metalloregulator ArsR/SmtB family transcription factor [Pleomorphomonas sp. T1.2MG-36]CAI9416085.1 HTH-type transcriptional regulator [Pleomorphomonas sp. T1.2MG-36]
MISTEERLDAVFHALSNRTRRQLIADLARCPARVNELARPYDMSVNAISKHLFVLEKAGLLERRQDGGTQSCALTPFALSEASQWIEHYRHYWTSQLDGLAGFVEGQADEE